MAVTDNFNRANGALGANWTNAGSGFAANVIVSNQVAPTGTTFFSVDHYTGSSWNATQTSTVKIGVQAGQIGVTVRGSSGSFYSFNISWGGANWSGQIYRWDSGTPTSIQNIGGGLSGAVGDDVTLEISGTTLKAKIAGSQVGTDTTDATHASGSPGIIAYDGTASLLDDWTGTGEVAAGGNPWYSYAQQQ